MIRTNTRMTLMHFHDFYFLQALQAGIIAEISRNPDIQFTRKVEKLQMDVQDALDEITPNIALRTFVYLYAACAGEARHARSANAERRFLPEVANSHRSQVYSNITDYTPNKNNLNALISIFEQDWKSGFGGR